MFPGHFPVLSPSVGLWNEARGDSIDCFERFEVSFPHVPTSLSQGHHLRQFFSAPQLFAAEVGQTLRKYVVISEVGSRTVTLAVLPTEILHN